MLGAIKYNLANLLNLQGRDARQTFWYYILFLVVMQFGAGMLASIPMYVSMFSSIFESVSRGVPEPQAMERMMVDMVDQVRFQMIVSVVTSVIIAGLMIASFVRRLHDGGFAGWIVVVPLATQAFSIVYTLSFLDRMEELMLASMTDPASVNADPFAMQAEMGVWSLVGWIGYIVVIIFGVLKSQDGPNRYGEEPVRF